MRRISCVDIGFACKHVVEAETDDELLEQARAHAREEHGATEVDEDVLRAAIHDRQ